jgi:DNA-binding beta-propeller fold protein YncE
MTIRARRPPALAVPVLAALILVSGACTFGADRPLARETGPASPSLSSPLHLIIGSVPYRLQAPVERETAVTDGHRIYLAGGLDSGGSSVAGVFSLNPATGALAFLGSLPLRVHDAAAALIAGRLFVFGGGSTRATDAVQSFDLRSRKARVAGRLPAPLADVSAATIGGTTYLVGGWDGSRPSTAIYATTDGTHFRTAAHLHSGVRYAAVAAVGSDLLVAGGEDARGRPLSTVSLFDTSSGTVSGVTTLPSPVSQAASFELGGTVYVVGGKDVGGNAVADVWGIDPRTDMVTQMPSLRRPVSDAAIVATSERAWLIGGWRGLAVSQVLVARLASGGVSGAGRSAELLRPLPGRTPGDAASVRPFAGKLLVADRGNDRLLVVDAQGHVLWRYPSPSLPPPPFPFYFPDDAFWVHGGHAILVNEEENDVLAEIAYPSGRTLWTYGHPRSAGSAPGYLHQPDDVYPYPGGGVVVADALNCRLLFFDQRGRPTRQIGHTGNCASGLPSTVGYPNGDTPLPNGHLLVSELHGGVIDEVTATGRPVWSVKIPDLSVPSDPQKLPGGNSYVAADYSSPGAVVRFARSGRVLWAYRPTSGPGRLDHPSLAAWLPNGLVAVCDDYNDRMLLIDPKTDRIVWQYGRVDRPGRQDGFLHIPDGFDLLLPGGQIPLHVDFASPRPHPGRP